jgi:hypothetical protein
MQQAPGYYQAPPPTTVVVQQQPYVGMPQAQPVSGAYWLLPFFLGIIGGIIGYFMVKDRNRGTANGLLVFGIVWTVIWVIIDYVVLYAYLGFYGI